MSHRVLVTGGAGFIGSHLCRRLLGQGDEVICLDNFYTGREQNIESLLSSPRFHVVRQDVTEPWPGTVDHVYNLACPASPVHYQRQPVATIKTCVLGALRTLDLAERTGARVLQASTSEVYGNPQVHPQAESYLGQVNCIGPRACYDEGKRVAEALFFDYQRQANVDIRVARIFNTYGPSMAVDDGRVVSNFLVQALRGEPLTVYGDGSQTRSFCYVDDLVEGLVAMMRDGMPAGPMNLGNPNEFTVLDLAKRVLALTGSRSKIVHRPLPPDDPVRRQPDIALARRVLGWEPSMTLAEGLKPTADYFRALLSQNRS